MRGYKKILASPNISTNTSIVSGQSFQNSNELQDHILKVQKGQTSACNQYKKSFSAKRFLAHIVRNKHQNDYFYTVISALIKWMMLKCVAQRYKY